MTTTRTGLRARVLSAGAAAVVVVACRINGGTVPPPNHDDLLDFEREYIAIAQRVGTVIEFGIGDAPSLKHAIRDVDERRLTGDRLRAYSRSWEAALEREGEALDRLDPPRRLGAARDLFLSAIGDYKDVARLLGEAASTSGAEPLAGILDRAIAAGSRGDSAFDQGATVIQDQRRALGLDENVALPDLHQQNPADENVRVVDPESVDPEE